ncbi:MAG: efflux RND transporter periplasmic adaptor subunit [Pseudomonadota bacterium]|nr:efflux RND transporter periplasmic adaptor subunit [Pseudomonadota bacterium]
MKFATTLIIMAAIGVGGYYWFINQEQAPSGRPRTAAPVLVVAAPVALQPLQEIIEALGTAQANESVTVTASLTDTVRRINFGDGGYVEAGDVLVELTSEEEEAQLAEARADLDEARRQLMRLEDLDKRGIVATSDVDMARSAAKAAEARLNAELARLKDRLIRAPFSGLLGFREVSPGTLLGPSDTITTIDDVSQIKLDFTVSEKFLAVMQPGRRIYASSASWPDREFEGVVRAVASRVDPVTRAVVVRAIIPNEDRALRPGMLLTVRVVAAESIAIVVPERSVVQVGNSSFVYIVGSDQRAYQREVELGARQLGIVEVLKGLEEDELLVTEGIIKLREGALVQLTDTGPRVVKRPSEAQRESTARPDSAAVSKRQMTPVRSN